LVTPVLVLIGWPFSLSQAALAASSPRYLRITEPVTGATCFASEPATPSETSVKGRNLRPMIVSGLRPKLLCSSLSVSSVYSTGTSEM